MRRLALTTLLTLSNVATSQQPPNLLVVVTDDQRADALGCAGHSFVQTPHLDALARRGTRFTNSFVTTPICAASRASIFCGTWESTHGYTFGKPPLADEHLESSWPARLREGGYRTGFVGKWGVRTRRGAANALWDSFESNGAPYLREQDGGGLRHLTDITTDHAIDFLRDDEGAKPFCLMVSFNAPHAEDRNQDQYIPAPSLRRAYEKDLISPPALGEAEFFDALPEFQRESLNRVRWHLRFDTTAKRERMVRNYQAMITGVDRAFGRIVDELHARGVAENTVVLFTSDNGCFLGERGFAGKWTIHEESIRVPLLVHDPRIPSQPPLLDQMVLNVDLAPTILALAGIDAPASYQGRDLGPLLIGAAPDWREDFFCEHRFDHQKIPKNEGVRGKRWVYTRYYEQDPVHEELYDLASDAAQRHNLARLPEHADVLARMRERCDELRDRYRR